MIVPGTLLREKRHFKCSSPSRVVLSLIFIWYTCYWLRDNCSYNISTEETCAIIPWVPLWKMTWVPHIVLSLWCPSLSWDLLHSLYWISSEKIWTLDISSCLTHVEVHCLYFNFNVPFRERTENASPYYTTVNWPFFRRIVTWSENTLRNASAFITCWWYAHIAYMYMHALWHTWP